MYSVGHGSMGAHCTVVKCQWGTSLYSGAGLHLWYDWCKLDDPRRLVCSWVGVLGPRCASGRRREGVLVVAVLVSLVLVSVSFWPRYLLQQFPWGDTGRINCWSRGDPGVS